MTQIINNIFDLKPDYKPLVGVMGSASGYIMRNPMAVEASHGIGRAIAGAGGTLVNGACPGLPDEAAKACKEAGGETFGVSPAISIRSHIDRYKSPVDHYDQLLFTGVGLMQRDIMNIRSCNAVIILPGGTGTLNEFIVAYDEGKPIGILEGCGGCADHIRDILKFCHREVTDRMVFSSDPEELVTRVIEIARTIKVPSYLDDYLIGDQGEVTRIEKEHEA